jgi:hypothetical protein
VEGTRIVRTASTTAVLVAAALLLPSPATPASADAQPWTDTPAVPLPPGAAGGQLNDITALALDDAWAVGSWTDTTAHPLAVHWDGTSWTGVPIDDGNSSGRYRLAAVDAVAAGDVWAAGSVASTAPGGPDAPLVLHFTNGAWQVQPVLVTGALKGIDMVSATDGWAVGEDIAADGRPRPIALRYQSGSWSQTALQVPTGARLTSVFGSPTGQAWAVGSHQQADGGQGALIVRWDGMEWRTVVATTVSPATHTSLSRVGGWSTTDAWAVGTVCENSNVPAANCGLAMHLSGGAWTPVETTGGTELTGIAAHAPANVWLAGYVAFDSKTDTDHVEQWNGTTLTSDDTVHKVVPVIDNRGQIGSALAAATTDHVGGLWGRRLDPAGRFYDAERAAPDKVWAEMTETLGVLGDFIGEDLIQYTGGRYGEKGRNCR